MMDRNFTVAASTAFLFFAALFVGCGDSDSDHDGTDATNSSLTSGDSDTSGSPTDGTEPEPAEWETSSQPTAVAKPKKKSDDWEISLESADKAGYDAVLKKNIGSVVLVDFWGTWCLACMKDFPHTVELSRKYRDQGLRVVSFSIESDDEARGQGLAFLKKVDASLIENLTCSIDFDDAFEPFDLIGLPDYRVYNREGKLVKRFSNGDNIDEETAFTHEDIEAAVREALGLPAENAAKQDDVKKDDTKENDIPKDDAAEGAE
jgi:thiol-disulfide isomerase/thioredoxin